MTWTCNQSSPGSSRAPHTLGTYLGSWDSHGAGLSSACCWTDKSPAGHSRQAASPACASPGAQLVLQPGVLMSPKPGWEQRGSQTFCLPLLPWAGGLEPATGYPGDQQPSPLFPLSGRGSTSPQQLEVSPLPREVHMLSHICLPQPSQLPGKGPSTSPKPANSPQGEPRAQGSSSPPQFQPDALGL